jgi:hypothetical protein
MCTIDAYVFGAMYLVLIFAFASVDTQSRPLIDT